MEQLAQWDRDFFVYLNNLNNGSLDNFWLAVTHIQNWIPLYILFFFMFWKILSHKKAIQASILTFCTLGSILLLTSIVKKFAGRIRPSNTPELRTLIRVLQTPEDYSFWSGHAATSMAITVFVVSVLNTKTRWVFLFFTWPVLFTLSRIFVGVHYLSDLLIGAIMGSLIGLLYSRLYTGLSKGKLA